VNKKEEEIIKRRPRIDLSGKLIERLKNKLKEMNLKYTQNLETLENSRKNEFYKNLKLKISKRVLAYLNAQEKKEVIEREKLIMKEMDKEIQKLASRISKSNQKWRARITKRNKRITLNKFKTIRS
jgi:Mg/Co/Ni transporter MgtE